VKVVFGNNLIAVYTALRHKIDKTYLAMGDPEAKVLEIPLTLP